MIIIVLRAHDRCAALHQMPESETMLGHALVFGRLLLLARPLCSRGEAMRRHNFEGFSKRRQ